MIRLVVVAPPGADDAMDAPTLGGLAESLGRQARSVRVPVAEVVVATDLAAVREALVAAAAVAEPVGLVPADLVAHPSLLGDTLDDPRRPVAALVLDDERLAALRLDADAAWAVSRRLRRVTVPATPDRVRGSARDSAPGAARPGDADGAGGAVGTHGAAGAAGAAGPEGAGEAGEDAGPIETVLGTLTDVGVHVARLRPGGLVARLPGAAPDARAAAFDALARTSEHRVRLASAARSGDGFYSTFVVRRLSRPLTGVAVRLRVTPNVVTLLSLAIGLLAAWLLTAPGLVPRLAGAVLLQVSLVVDCVDGELARYTRRFTPLGAWLDGVGDRVKEYAVLAALAVAAGAAPGAGPLGTGGAQASGLSGVATGAWLLAVAGLAVMTYRHVADHHFTVRARAGLPAPAPGLAADMPATPETPLVWLRRVLQFPVGERWLVLSVAVVVAGPQPALAAFAVLAVASVVWTTGGRLLRARRFGGAAGDRFGWLVPAVRVLLEAAVVGAAFAWRAPGRLWLAYSLLAVVAYHAYDLVYREKYRVPDPPPVVRRASLTGGGRAILVAVAALLGAGPLVVVTAVLLGWLCVLFGGESIWAWVRWVRARPTVEEEER